MCLFIDIYSALYNSVWQIALPPTCARSLAYYVSYAGQQQLWVTFTFGAGQGAGGMTAWCARAFKNFPFKISNPLCLASQCRQKFCP